MKSQVGIHNEDCLFCLFGVLRRINSHFSYLTATVQKSMFLGLFLCGVRGREVERRPCNHVVPSSSPGSESQLWDFSLAYTCCMSTDVVPRKQNQERLV